MNRRCDLFGYSDGRDFFLRIGSYWWIVENVLLIQPCNFEDFPAGGILSSCKQMMKVFGSHLALVGISTDSTPVGTWIEKGFGGVTFKYFAIGRWKSSAKKPLVPLGLTAYFQLRRYRRAIFSLGIYNLYTQSPEAIMAMSAMPWKSICFRFAGVDNSLRMPRYKWARLFASTYERWMFSALKSVDTILASAGKDAINEMVQRSRCKLSTERVIQFPTRVDTDLFRPQCKQKVRSELGISQDEILVVACGRINAVKGWDLILDSFKIFSMRFQKASMYFVGDGEDHNLLLEKAADSDLEKSVKITGFLRPQQVARYLNAADLVVVGSHFEGWSVAMLEALACGKPIVSTTVSGAREMVVENANGYIVEDRNPRCFAAAMNRAFALKDADKVSRGIAEKYALKTLARDLGALWKPLA
jgi:glycosyltransferase involved in cell wall biosynthesis